MYDNHNISKQGVKQKENVFHSTHESFFLDTLSTMFRL